MPGVGVRSPSSPGLGVGVGGSPPADGGGASSPNPNLLLWSEAIDNAVWSRTAVTQILANNTLAPDSTMTADLVTLDVFGAVRQVSTTAAATGAGNTTSIFDVATVWTRYEVIATFDLELYVFSVYLKQSEAGIGGRIRLDRSGGFLRCSYEDVGDGGACWIWGAQLETGVAATAYVKREGT